MQHKVVVCALAAAGVAFVATVPAASAPTAASGLPARGELVPAKSLAGVRLGMTKRQVLMVWGGRHGVCRQCAQTTWYFNYRPFEPEGAGVVFRRGRVIQAFTVWRPPGWRTASGLTRGAEQAEVREAAPGLVKRNCGDYAALVAPRGGVVSVFYVYRAKLWGFGLTRPGRSPCV